MNGVGTKRNMQIMMTHSHDLLLPVNTRRCYIQTIHFALAAPGGRRLVFCLGAVLYVSQRAIHERRGQVMALSQELVDAGPGIARIVKSDVMNYETKRSPRPPRH